MKKQFRVSVDVKIETVVVVVEATDSEEARALGIARAKDVIEKHLPGHQQGRARYEAIDAMEMVPPKTWNA
jgi:hypothetical protein